QSIVAASDDPLPQLLSQLGNVRQLINAGLLVLYFEDAPAQFRPTRNAIAQAAQLHMESLLPNMVRRQMVPSTRPLKIGYLASTLYRHSVGWLSRWLFKYHNRDRVEVHLYSTTPASDFVQQALRAEYGDRFHDVPANIGAIANQIADDEIDILVELDSLTSLGNCSVVTLKPAPIQVSWLGFDASGIPAIDYYIADSYVLPDDADSYYHEKIWRLPQTYIAVDGFEVYTPTLRRQDLAIPDDAIVYLSSQAGLKRNSHHTRTQLHILNEVPNSYFLIKSFSANPEALSSFFYQLADEVGVASDRLRFLPDFPSEFTYRANLQLADVVLDTYPYNGATTTLEALWMGLPIVTRVGEQFAARNSYTMMMNAGITEGIAWSDEEYVEWGIRMGQDENLRRDVYWKLRKSRHTAPLWNAKQFAREMEAAYEQMWRNI
ncbi:MAG: hypothetical protein IGR76_13605, partial [Synechococcales cyanobacterium T60_A2020_003]|nr:hypothetical protein [Synechococcales cyanobacterium T60_A2020_003]